MSEERDNIIEDRIRNSEEQIPSALSPENMEKRIAAMNLTEKYTRSQSEDIPADDVKGEKLETKKSSKLKIILPIALAAAVILTAGIGIGIGMGRQKKQDDVISREDDMTSKEKEDDEKAKGLFDGFSKKEKEENYSEAYKYLKAYNDSLKEYELVEYETDYVMEESAVDTTAGESSDSKQTLTTNGTAARSGSETPEFTDTNVRTEGVAEADIVKTDGKYIYEYDQYTEHLFFYSVDNGKIKKEGSVNVLDDDTSFQEMYISGDRLVLMGVKSEYDYFNTQGAKTIVSIYDISDKGEPKMVDVFEQSGYYDSSRMVDGKLYTFSKKSFDLDKLKKKDLDTYIPEAGNELIDNEDIFIEKSAYTSIYVVITSIDIEKAEYVDKMALLAGSDTLYVSADNIYLTDRTYNWTDFSYNDDTRLMKISYDDGELEYETTGSFPGYLNDDYSIDEYNGYVRLVTSYTGSDYNRYNGLYVFNEDLEKVSVIKKLAKGETIKSARFMGDTAYFVTFRNTDPLFAVDLSDPENPEITDYLKIPGFSAYLHPYGDGKMLGIGYDADENGWTNCIKFTMFDVTDPYDIKEEDTKILYDYQSASVLSDRNAFMFNQNDGTFGLALNADGYSYIDEDWFKEELGDEYEDIIANYDPDKYGVYYMVADYDEKEGFQILMDEELNSDDTYGWEDMVGTRGIVIGDYLYVVQSGVGIKSYDTSDYKMVDECN